MPSQPNQHKYTLREAGETNTSLSDTTRNIRPSSTEEEKHVNPGKQIRDKYHTYTLQTAKDQLLSTLTGSTKNYTYRTKA